MIQEALQAYQPISLGEMDSVTLMNRIDSKYVLCTDLLPHVLRHMQNHYQVLEMKQKRIFPYRSLYYDTHDDAMYMDHHNGKVNRFKIRFREYTDTGDRFLEIKRKIKGTRTVKHRIMVSSLEDRLSPESAQFITKHTPFDTRRLAPSIFTDFSRITLVSNAMNERVTVDLSLNFVKEQVSHHAGKLAIIELKRAGTAQSSHLISIIEHYGIPAIGFSKYCIGRALLDDGLKSNNFKERILTLNKINYGKLYYRNFSEYAAVRN